MREQIFCQGYAQIENHRMFHHLDGDIYMRSNKNYGKNGAAVVDKKGNIYVNTDYPFQADEWAYVIAHCLLHLAFGHFDNDNIPKDAVGNFHSALWNQACDIYIARFLADIKFGRAICEDPASHYSIKLNDEQKIYEHLLYLSSNDITTKYGTNGSEPDLMGIEHPIIYKAGEKNEFVEMFSYALNTSVSNAVHHAGGHTDRKKDTIVTKAANWFLTHYPLLGSIAASFKIIEDVDLCYKYEIHIAAVDISLGEIYINPTANLSMEEWKFVLAHEYLHAGLAHHKRCLGMDKYLWNVACDYVINSWLQEMKIGKMPEEGLLYDETLKDYSAESIYDIIVKEMRKFKKHATFRGFGHGDIMSDDVKGFQRDMASKGISLDEFFKNALKEGFDFHSNNQRGYLPAGLVAEIRALSTPPIPWEVELGKWFDYQFPPLEKHRSYARPSRRQGATPDIPRPRYIMQEQDFANRTFGVVVDTSGSMSCNQLGLALGAIASYATSKEVPFVRVVFCDADAYDAGYMTPEDIASRVKVTGGGGTILQPAITLLEKAKDFPEDGPILIITDGYIEEKISIHHNHAFLLPKGHKLPFVPKGKVFYFRERGHF
ncbi:MAG: hypothetical protein IJA10_04010 [Lachnospiraceae bacterium]|nr:hypothetical protein [Lachnospiraceae bacterium]